MIVCMCNRINDSRIRAAIAAGARNPAEVFKKLGQPRGCGQCLDAIELLLTTAKEEKTSA